MCCCFVAGVCCRCLVQTACFSQSLRADVRPDSRKQGRRRGRPVQCAKGLRMLRGGLTSQIRLGIHGLLRWSRTCSAGVRRCRHPQVARRRCVGFALKLMGPPCARLLPCGLERCRFFPSSVLDCLRRALRFASRLIRNGLPRSDDCPQVPAHWHGLAARGGSETGTNRRATKARRTFENDDPEWRLGLRRRAAAPRRCRWPAPPRRCPGPRTWPPGRC